MFAALYLLPRLVPAGPDAATALIAVASEFSPRVERHDDAMVALDVDGVGRLFGDAREIADALRRAAADRALAVHVAVAPTRTAALLLARARAGVTVAEPGTEAASVASLPLSALEMGNVDTPHSPFHILKRWGVKTLGDLAALPVADLHARLGAEGARLHRLARGEDACPLVPLVPEEPFEESLELEWPIDGLEPLSFVLGRLCDGLAVRLDRHDCGAAVLHARFRLVTRETLERTLHLPAPMRDPRVLRTLILLDLESYLTTQPSAEHLPAGIDAVTIRADPAPGPIVQFSLLERATPSPESLSTLLARLTALMGEGRCGAPALVDSHRPEAFDMRAFEARNEERGTRTKRGTRNKRGTRSDEPCSAFHVQRSTFVPHSSFHVPRSVLRRFRHPVPVRVVVERGRPVGLVSWRRGVPGGRIEQSAGPWRTSGEWWAQKGFGIQESGFGNGKDLRVTRPESRIPNPESRGSWDRDEWEVALGDGTVYRIHLDRARDQWFIDGVFD